MLFAPSLVDRKTDINRCQSISCFGGGSAENNFTFQLLKGNFCHESVMHLCTITTAADAQEKRFCSLSGSWPARWPTPTSLSLPKHSRLHRTTHRYLQRFISLFQRSWFITCLAVNFCFLKVKGGDLCSTSSFTFTKSDAAAVRRASNDDPTMLWNAFIRLLNVVNCRSNYLRRCVAPSVLKGGVCLFYTCELESIFVWDTVNHLCVPLYLLLPI